MITREEYNKMYIWEKLSALDALLQDRDKILEELEASNKEAKYWKEMAQNYEQEAKSLRRENNALKALLKELKEELNKKPTVKTVVIEKPVIKEVEKVVEKPKLVESDEGKYVDVEKTLKKTSSFDIRLSQLRRCLDRYA